MAVLGLGRLGSRELTAGSDLDLVVLYDFDPVARESSGPRRLDAVVYYTRLTQRLIGALSAPTRRGRLYDVDLRLRPQGGKGPVASQFDGFLAYQESEAELWEHMALTRARVIAGDPAFGAEVTRAVGRIVASRRDPAHVAREVRTMRALIAQEKGDDDPWDLKLASGGLTDLDFLAQALVLGHAHRHGSLAGLSPEPTFGAAARAGLLGDEDAKTLETAHRLFNDVFQWQRLTIEGDFKAAEVPRAILQRLAAVPGLPNAKALLDHLGETRRAVRTIFDRVLAS
jgi:[glutamine synthetase] adenylyltransferase / [glutamine synthetase]-adenylyl-L-tyrosine phosphorylase